MYNWPLVVSVQNIVTFRVRHRNHRRTRVWNGDYTTVRHRNHRRTRVWNGDYTTVRHRNHRITRVWKLWRLRHCENMNLTIPNREGDNPELCETV